MTDEVGGLLGLLRDCRTPGPGGGQGRGLFAVEVVEPRVLRPKEGLRVRHPVRRRFPPRRDGAEVPGRGDKLLGLRRRTAGVVRIRRALQASLPGLDRRLLADLSWVGGPEGLEARGVMSRSTRGPGRGHMFGVLICLFLLLSLFFFLYLYIYIYICRVTFA